MRINLNVTNINIYLVKIRFWLNEGFATYMSYLAYFNIEKEAEKTIDWDVFFITKSRMNDALVDPQTQTHPIYQQGTGFELAGFKVAYDRAAIVLRMIAETIGKTAFQTGIRKYLKYNKYKNVAKDDLWNSLSSEIHTDSKQNVSLKKSFNTWIKQPGHPIVTVKRCYKLTCMNIIKFNQQRFVINVASIGSDNIITKAYLINSTTSDGLWSIPISYVVVSKHNRKILDDAKPKLWMDEQVEVYHKHVGSTPLNKDTALIVNVKHAGKYHMNDKKIEHI